MQRASRSDAQQAFGERVRELRSDLGISQEQLAELSGSHRIYVGSVQRGERNISLDAITALAMTLKVPTRDLF